MTTKDVQDRLRRWQLMRDQEAFGELLKVHRDRAYATALRIVGNGTDAEDIVQEACLKLLTRTNGFESPEAFRVTVYRAVVQCAFDWIRSRRRAQNGRDRWARDAQSGEAAMGESSLELEQEEMLQMLRRAMAHLPEDERVAVVLCFQQGLRLGEAAQVLDLPRQTLRDRLDKALIRLKGEMKRKGALISMFMLGDLFRLEGLTVAPPSLCSALDRILGGRSCAALNEDLPSSPEPSVFAKGVPGVGLKTGLVGVTACIAAMADSSPFSQNRLNRSPSLCCVIRLILH